MYKLNIFATESYNNDSNQDTVIDSVDILKSASNAENVPNNEVEFPDAQVDHNVAVQNIVNDIDVLTESMATALESADTLTRIQDVLRPHCENGVSVRAAKLAMICTEDISKRLGITSRVDIPALECFSNIHTSGPVTRISVESIGEFFSKLWTGIVNIFKRIWEAVTNLFSGGFQKAEERRLEKYNAILEANMVELKKKKEDELPKDAMVTDFKYNQMFTLPGQPASVNTIKTILQNGIDLLKHFDNLKSQYKMYIGAVQIAIDQYEIAIRSQADMKKLKEAKDKVMNIIDHEINTFFERSFKKPKSSDLTLKDKEKIAQHPQSKNTLTSHYLIAGNHFLFFKELIPHFDAYSYQCEEVYGEPEVPHSGASFPYPNVNETCEISSLFNRLSEAVQNYSEMSAGTFSSTTSIMKQMENIQFLINQMTNYTDETRKVLMEEARQQGTILLGLMNGPVAMNMRVYNEVKKTLNFVESFTRKVSNHYGLGKKAA